LSPDEATKYPSAIPIARELTVAATPISAEESPADWQRDTIFVGVSGKVRFAAYSCCILGDGNTLICMLSL
jgi:hypothetical protein